MEEIKAFQSLDGFVYRTKEEAARRDHNFKCTRLNDTAQWLAWNGSEKSVDLIFNLLSTLVKLEKERIDGTGD